MKPKRDTLLAEKPITNRRRSEQEVEFSRGILSSMGSAVMMIATDGRFVYVNDACCRMLGFSSGELLHLTVSDLNPDYPAHAWPEHWQEVRKGGHRVIEARCRIKSGGFIPVELLVNPLEISGHEYHCVILRDITERKQITDALQRSEENFRALFEGSHEAIMLLDSEGVALCANTAMCQRMGVTMPDFVGTHVFNILPKDLAASRKGHFNKVVETGQPLSFEDERNGRTMDTHLYPIKGASGKVSRVAIFVHDITDRKKIEEDLRKSRDELESRVKERTARLQSLAAELTQAEHRERRRIAHILHEDLQQHLVAMQCKVSGLKGSRGTGLSAPDAEWLLQELAQTIQLSRDLTVRLRPPILYEFGLKPALDWLADDMNARFGLAVTVRGVQKFRLISDEMRALAFEATSELLMNVVKHAGVTSAQIHIRRAPEGCIAIEISDKGKGFDTTSLTQEMKFGLFSIRERIEALGGRLDVTSHPGKGTCAALTLPAKIG